MHQLQTARQADHSNVAETKGRNFGLTTKFIKVSRRTKSILRFQGVIPAVIARMLGVHLSRTANLGSNTLASELTVALWQGVAHVGA